MALPAREQLRTTVSRYVEVPGARLLRAAGLTPNSVTILGFSISVAAAVTVGYGHLLAGGLVFLGGSFFDLMDGAYARLTGKASRFGALLDSTLDRLGEAALFLGLMIHGLRSDLGDARLLFLIVALFLALVASQTVSYLRARGEGLGISTKAGFMTRPERVVLLSLGLVIGLRAVEVILVVIATVSFLTLLQRLFHIRRSLNEGSAPAPGTIQGVDEGDNPL